MRTVRPASTLAAVAAVLASLSLTGCGLTVSFDQNGEGDQPVETHGPAQPPETAQPDDQPVDQSTANADADSSGSTGANSGSSSGSGSDAGSGSSTSTGAGSNSGSSTSSDSSSSSGSNSAGSASNSASGSGSSSSSTGTGTGSGDSGFQLDENGSGTIPESVLEKNIRDTYAKQGTTIEKVDCNADLRVYSGTGSQSCTVTAPGGKNYYGVVKVVDVVGNQVEYKLEFAGIDF